MADYSRTTSIMETTKRCRVCVIGAGPSGMSLLYHFAQLRQHSPEVVCYERGSEWVGQWNYTWRSVTDEYGENVCSGIYRDMWVNLPKEVMEVAHYTFEKHFEKTIPSYFPASVMASYLKGYWKSSDVDLSKAIRFNTSVTSVSYNPESDDFTVVARDVTRSRTLPPETFSHVVVATGMFSMPNIPEYKGFETFPGRIMHSKHFKGGQEFRGRRVLVLGSRFSAEDVSMQCYKHGVDHVIISWRHQPLGYKFPSNIEEKPLLVEVDGNVAKFRDGTSAVVDVIILCTGYRYDYAFLEDSLRLKEDITTFYSEDLYKGMVWLKGGHQKLLYIGALWLVTSLPMTDAQAVWIVQYITGRSPVGGKDGKIVTLTASPAEIEDYNVDFKQKLATLADIPAAVECRRYYIRDIADDTGYNIDIGTISECLVQCFKDRADHILEFRDFQFTSAYTGKKAGPPATKWIDFFGDEDINVQGSS